MADKTVRVGLENTSFVPVSPATSGAQTDGTQKTQIVDSGGEAVTVTGNRLDVNATVTPSGTQDVNLITVAGAALALGQQLAAASLPVILPAATITTLTPPAAITGFATSAKQDTLLAELQLKADLTETQPVSLASVPLPSGAATSALQGGGLPAALGAGGGVKIDGSGTALPVSVASLPLPSGASTLAEQQTQTASLSVLDDWDNTASDGASVSGDVAHDSPDAGEPVKVGGKAYAFDGTVPQTAVAEADRVNAIFDLTGRQYVCDIHPNFWSASVDYASAQTNATVVAAPGAGSLFITDIVISNGATAGNITLLDGSGGTVKFECYPGINGGVAHSFKTPIKLTATTLLAITSTTVTTHSVTVSGFTA